MSNDAPKLPTALVVLTSIAVLSSALICMNMHHTRDTFLPMSIVAAAGLLALGIAARR